MDLSQYERIVFFTGAGMSAESGVPTYRGPGGIWKTYDFEAYACQPAFDRDPEKVWEFHNYRRKLVGACAPNAGHAAIAKIEADHDVTVVTQNIDGLHQLAGTARVHELHGSLWRVRCERCGNRDAGRAIPLEPLRCGACDHYWRPDITWFGDALDMDTFMAAHAAMASCDLLVSVGTSGVVFPAAGLPIEAKRAGARCVEINPEETALSELYDEHLRRPAAEVLAEWVR